MNRRKFIAVSAAGAATYLFIPAGVFVQKKDKGPPIQMEIVKEFVVAGHGNFARTQEMLADKPALLNATWDWGGGDYETALGGASHVGSKEVAEFLIKNGARMDLFAAIMLGKLEIVREITSAFPEALNSKGPHGLTLVHHAKKGGKEALAVLDYLNTKGIKG